MTRQGEAATNKADAEESHSPVDARCCGPCALCLPLSFLLKSDLSGESLQGHVLMCQTIAAIPESSHWPLEAILQ